MDEKERNENGGYENGTMEDRKQQDMTGNQPEAGTEQPGTAWNGQRNASGQPGPAWNQAGGMPVQPGPDASWNQPGRAPAQPGASWNQPGRAPVQPGASWNQAGGVQGQPGAAWNQNGYTVSPSPYQGAPQMPERFLGGTEAPVKVSEWVVTLLLLSIPCVGLILMLAWGFGDTAEKESKVNFCRASLIWTGIICGLVLLIYLIVAIVMAAAM